MRAQAPGQSVLLLLDVVELLAASKVDYAVIGALAAAVHGSVRATIDADALVSASRSTFESLLVDIQLATGNGDCDAADQYSPLADIYLPCLMLRAGYSDSIRSFLRQRDEAVLLPTGFHGDSVPARRFAADGVCEPLVLAPAMLPHRWRGATRIRSS
jgi:hypothetical protein